MPPVDDEDVPVPVPLLELVPADALLVSLALAPEVPDVPALAVRALSALVEVLSLDDAVPALLDAVLLLSGDCDAEAALA